ncbi:MAG TPA: thioredoxin domain-containing protein [Thermoleophilaceae bacterium]
MTDERRKRRLAIFGGIVLVAIAAVAVAIAAGSGGGSKSSSTKPGTALAGIPQSGNTLGSKNAKATMMVFADMQCPFCRQFETQAFPSIVNRYVKSGKLRVVFQPISFIGSDSVVAAKAVAAASQQNKLFDYASAFYANQGEENTGYVTDAFLTKIAKAVPGLNVAKWQSALNTEFGTDILSRAESASKTAGVSSTPTFLVAKTGGTKQKFQPSTLTAGAFSAKLNALTA